MAKTSQHQRCSLLLLILLVFSTGVIGCRKSDDDTDPKVADSDRPIDSIEGVPGFLTDPAAVSMESKEGGKLQINGKPAAIAVVHRPSADVRLAIWAWNPSDPIQSESLGKKVIPAKLLGSTKVADDGSFTAEISTTGDAVLICGVLLSPKTDAIELPSINPGLLPGQASLHIVKRLGQPGGWEAFTFENLEGQKNAR